MKRFSVFVVCSLFVVAAQAQPLLEIFPKNEDFLKRETATVEVASPQDGKIEVKEAADSFHRSVIQAAVKAQRAGSLKRLDVVRLRVAMLSPAFRQHAEDLAVVQMSASGSDNTPIGEDGQVDRASIDWEAFFAFIERLLPLLLQLLDAFSSIDSGVMAESYC
jgi:hypothetical protein